MKKLLLLCTALAILTGCEKTEPVTFCYELPPQEIKPGVNCIPNGGTSS